MSTKNSSTYLIFSAIVIAGLIIGGAIIYSNDSSSSSSQASLIGDEQSSESSKVTVTDGQIRGNSEASIVIVEFSDFECPYCANFHQTMNQVISDYPEDIKWIYKHFPLAFHEYARPTAEASECAAEQGKFWEFADQIFENQSRLGQDLYTEIVQDLGLNPDQFQECVSSRKYKDKVESDYQEGISAGVKGTPGSFINGVPLGGAVPYNQLKGAIDDLLENK